ncbi:MAG: PDZ domain-containing protein [Planctomycetes bacterium]|nr:PDZ domain-containing protein [Planctomycetota bacterium]
MNRTQSAIVAILSAAGSVTAAAAEPTLAEEAAIKAAVERVAAAVVRIEPLALSTESASDTEAKVGVGPSTGLAVATGSVITTSFAVPADVDAAVIVLPDGGRRAAAVRARDTARGLVLLAVEGLPAPPPLEALPRRQLRPGQWAIAVGRAWNAAAPSLAVGIVSAVDRAWGKAVQTDAATSPMNYGGPLVDIAGRVIGILVPLPADTAGMTEGTELYDAGIGFAVPLEDVLATLPRLERGESLAPGILGIGYRDADTINGQPVIGSVRQGSPAARAGLRPGDRIVRIDGRAVARIADARHAVAPRYAGDTIAIVVERGEKRSVVEVQARLIGELPPWRQTVLGLVTPAKKAAAGDADATAGIDVEWVLPGGPAERAGLRAGDRLDTITIDDSSPPTAIVDRAVLAGVLAGVEPGVEVTLTFTRDAVSTVARMAPTAMPDAVPDSTPGRAVPVNDPLAGPRDAVEVVRLGGAEIANPGLAVIPRGDVPTGVLVWCGPPHGPVVEAEAAAWKAAAARHGVTVVLPASRQADAWTAADIATVARLLAALHTRRPIDPARVATAGSGPGAAFAWLVAERLGASVDGVALVGASLPRRAAVEPAAAGFARWVLLGPGGDEAARQRVAADRVRLRAAGHAAGLLDEAVAAPPVDLLCRWVAVLGML